MAEPLSIPPEVMRLLFGMPQAGMSQAEGTQQLLARGPSPSVQDRYYPNVPLMQPQPGEDPRPYAEAAKNLITEAFGRQKAAEPDLSTPSGQLSLAMGIMGGPRLKLPPAIGAYHGTGSPVNFTEFKLPPATHDIGVHSTIDPVVPSMYQRPPGINKQKFLPNDLIDSAGPRTIPVVLDVKSALAFPGDAGKWNIPSNVTSTLEDAMKSGFKAPRGLLDELHNIAGSEQVWQRDFSPLLKSLGYDSLYYPHGSINTPHKYNTFLTLNAEQTIPRFTREGQKLIAQRGIHEPMKYDVFDNPTREQTSWRLPQGILKPRPEYESLLKDPKFNTHQWWAEDAPPSVLKNISKDIEAQQAYWAQQAEEHKNTKIINTEINQKLWDKFLADNPGFKFPKEVKKPNPESSFFGDSLDFAKKYATQPYKEIWTYMDAVKYNHGLDISPNTMKGFINNSDTPALAKAKFDEYVKFKKGQITPNQYSENMHVLDNPTLYPKAQPKGVLTPKLGEEATNPDEVLAKLKKLSTIGGEDPKIMADFQAHVKTSGKEGEWGKFWSKVYEDPVLSDLHTNIIKENALGKSPQEAWKTLKEIKTWISE